MGKCVKKVIVLWRTCKNFDTRPELRSMKDIAEAQGGIEELVTWTNLSPQTLTYLLNTEHPPQLDKVFDLLSTLKDARHSKHAFMEKHNENQAS